VKMLKKSKDKINHVPEVYKKMHVTYFVSSISKKL